MAGPKYPDYVQKMIDEAEQLLGDEGDPDPCEAAAVCFDILAFFPEHEGAHKLIRRAVRDGNLIRDYRRALSRLIDERDDRPWQQHRRLALSFRYFSRWVGWERENEEEGEDELGGPSDVRAYLEQGHRQLLQDYLGGQAKGADVSWQIFREAIRLSKDTCKTMMWIGKEYAQQGYFAESADVLGELLTRYPKDEDAQRLLAEVRWWRDNVRNIPWIPPAGDGSRWRRMVKEEDPEWFEKYGVDETVLRQHIPPEPDELPPTMSYPTELPDGIANKMDALAGKLQSDAPNDSPVDWGYLDAIERREIDVSKFPKWARRMLSHITDPELRKDTEEMLAEQFSNKSLYDDAYFEESDDDEGEDIEEG